ncbi:MULTISPECIES: decarboxylase [Mycobacteriaceae]|uniref:decarboxylase n=1 Tax=Mycobacteriaceae TaxID=1762 RepID=UPI0007FC26C4|nr:MULTISPECIES: decarboxylase [Mycobacteriaceae]MCK0172891.1 decarboxylase [Mycolicibacterium sp. F2034L]OBB57807.1 decarboxylase [Mycobacterium sp. 852013-51886_SCH5428379]
MNRFRRTRALPRYAVCHRALRGTPLQVPAELLTTASVADWVRKRGVGVDVSGAEQLRLALEAGLPAARLAAQCPDVSTVEAAMTAAVGRFVIGSWTEVMLIAHRPAATARVVVDVTEATGERLAASVVGMGRLDVVGLRCRMRGDDDDAAAAVGAMVEQMARLRRAHGVIMTRACLSGFGRCDADPAALRDGVHQLQLAVEDACAELRYPRPALVLSLDAAALTDAN